MSNGYRMVCRERWGGLVGRADGARVEWGLRDGMGQCGKD
jgi:hypothetical protein